LHVQAGALAGQGELQCVAAPAQGLMPHISCSLAPHTHCKGTGGCAPAGTEACAREQHIGARRASSMQSYSRRQAGSARDGARVACACSRAWQPTSHASSSRAAALKPSCTPGRRRSVYHELAAVFDPDSRPWRQDSPGTRRAAHPLRDGHMPGRRGTCRAARRRRTGPTAWRAPARPR